MQQDVMDRYCFTSALLDCNFIEKWWVFMSAGYLLTRVATLVQNLTGPIAMVHLLIKTSLTFVLKFSRNITKEVMPLASLLKAAIRVAFMVTIMS